MNKRSYLIYIFLFLMLSESYGQADSLKSVTISGTIIDSLTHEGISEATVTLYQKDKQKILKYGFSGIRGTFRFTGIPSSDSILVLEVSHMGFLPRRCNVVLKPISRSAHLGNIAISKRSLQIEEVVINKPPIVMNRDTLEINPAAFELEPNALVEDLLKKVPGIVVWGDGEITVNGKKVEKVLVNGKSFFGSDVITATRNLPSGAVDKVKVYEQANSKINEEEKLEMDIILKKVNGLFGKVQMGMGTDNRKEGTILLNYFDVKNQISLYGGANNTNIRVQSLSEVLRGNVFKAGGEDVNVYVPVFARPGLNEFMVGGTRLRREWNAKLKSDIDALFISEKTDIQSQLSEIRYLENQGDQKIEQQGRNNRTQDQIRIGGTAHYKDRYDQLDVVANVRSVKNVNRMEKDRYIETTESTPLSEFNMDNKNITTQSVTDLKLNYINKFKSSLMGTEQLKVEYKLNFVDQHTENRQASSFRDYVGERNEQTNRIKDLKENRYNHELSAVFSMVSLARKIKLNGWSVLLNNKVRWLSIDADQRDRHFDSLSNSYAIVNGSLTYRDNYDEVDWTPGISFGRDKLQRKARGTDIYGFRIDGDMTLNVRKNRSSVVARELSQDASYLLPSASIYYRKTRQLWSSSLTLGVNKVIKQPEMEELLAVRDETQKDYNRIGNRNLRPESQYRFGLEYTRSGSLKNSWQRLLLNYTLITDQMVDSSLFLVEGERISYLVNTKGKPKYELQYLYRSAPKISDIPLNIFLQTAVTKSAYYYFNNAERYLNHRLHVSLNGEVTGTFYAHYKLGLGARSLNTRMTSNGRKSENRENSLTLNMTVTRLKRLTFINSISGTNFYIKHITSDYQYFWNVHVYYRMLQKEQLEIKLSAFDILNNSRNIETYMDYNIVRREERNNLRQYFMLSLSYYPRFF